MRGCNADPERRGADDDAARCGFESQHAPLCLSLFWFVFVTFEDSCVFEAVVSPSSCSSVLFSR